MPRARRSGTAWRRSATATGTSCRWSRPACRNPVPPVFGSGYSDDLEAVGADGCFPVPDGPGLGVEYDWDYIEKRRVGRDVFKA